MVGLEKTLYYVEENDPEGVVEVCIIVYRASNNNCPISFPFDVRIATVEESEGRGIAQLYLPQCVIYFLILRLSCTLNELTI